jgi:adenylosuccinate synthase
MGYIMPATIIVGGQFGSEGKGKVTALTASQLVAPWVVRCGGPNSGHTTVVHGTELVLRQLPAAAAQNDAKLAIAAGCVVDEKLLIEEIELCGLARNRVIVDPCAVLLEDFDGNNEDSLKSAIGSTGSGTGSASARRMLRCGKVRLVKDSQSIHNYASVEVVASKLHRALDGGEHVIVEGTQGFGLSLLHSGYFPFVTSKDTTASAFAMEAGLSPRDVSNVVLVIRTFPIRVAGNSGELPNETDWRAIQQMSGAPEEEPEYTSVTNRLRRVGFFDLGIVRAACRYNRPTSLAVLGLDRLHYPNRGVTNAAELSPTALDFLNMLRLELGIPVSWCGTGFATFDAIDMENPKRTVNSYA